MKNTILSFVIASLFFTTSCDNNNNNNNNNSAVTTQDTTKTSVHDIKDGYAINDIAAPFSLKNVDGNTLSLLDYQPSSKGYIVVFTCNHCPYAKKYEQRIMDLDNVFKDKGYPVVAINPNDPNIQPEDSYDNMVRLAKEKAYTFPYLIDETQEVYKQYGATKTPHVFILNKENNALVVKYIGAIDDNYEKPNEVKEHYVAEAILALLEGKSIDKTNTLAIGCSIKDKANEK